MTNLLYRQAIAGQAQAIEVVVNLLRPRITSMAIHYARCSGEDADDLRQEAWLGLLEALPRLDLSIGDPEQYLIRYARWRLLDAIKRARLRRCDSLDFLLENNLTDAMDLSFDEQMITVESTVAAMRIHEFLDELPNTQRCVLRCLLYGLTWRETAQALDCTSANIAYHVRQIRRRYQIWSEAAPSLMFDKCDSQDRSLASRPVQTIKHSEGDDSSLRKEVGEQCTR